MISVLSQGHFPQDRKRLRRLETEDVDHALYTWFKDARSKNVPLSGAILVEKVKEYAEKLGVATFTASAGWLDPFKSRHGIVMKRICGESVAVCQDTTKTWKDSQLKKLLEELSPGDIFNTDETGLFYKCLPNRTLALKGKKGTGRNIPKDQLTLLVAANMSGTEKLPFLAIFNFNKLRCLKNIKLPTEYKANTKAWMTGTIFEDSVRKLDRKYLLKGGSIALVINNCPAHPEGVKATT
ncbi:tigger transposable element-derived protein 6 [Elysia marginata]|uniref:Tigger transposable element-derived protein 6 n=1 Tax=Elysia marginata TaxID=1093978 RepID=A0AAV4FJC4_9GAST|nr:tigger transposable element-derived protein 6 [Elysia marginata]